MIEDIVKYDGEVILRMYHKGFDNENEQRNLVRKNEINGKIISLEEKYVKDEVIKNELSVFEFTECLLGTEDERNPYRGGSSCTFVKEFVILEKPKILFTQSGSLYELNIETKNFVQICEFIKKYLGVNLKKNPMNFGNVYIYECREIRAVGIEKGFSLPSKCIGSTVTVTFRNESMPVERENIAIKEESQLSITNVKYWNNFDLEVYFGKDLFFYQNQIAFMKSLRLSMEVASPKQKIDLPKIGSVFHQPSSKDQEIISGQKMTKSDLKMSTTKIRKMIELENEKENVVFVVPDELEKVKKTIMKAVEKSIKIWVFDPYFIDRNDRFYSFDWISFFSHINPYSEKKYVFYCKKNSDYKLEDFLKDLDTDFNYKKRPQSAREKNEFVETKVSIHDRFIITITKNEVYSGLVVGTSFNSLHKNYYVIYKLNHIAAKEILNKLSPWMKNENICNNEEEK